MKNVLLALGLTVVASVALAAFPDAHEAPPASWTGNVFRLSQAYPATLPPAEARPWAAFDPTKDTYEYVDALFHYALQGNVETEWQGSNNKVRPWFHAPWLHFGPNGREFVHGLTRERGTARTPPGKEGELGPLQKSCFQNWAVSLLNARGGYQMGQIWKDQNSPDVISAVFPEGTVVLKLLFSNATDEEVPYLKGSLEWDANIHDIPATDVDCKTTATRKVQKVRLFQMDLAVKDSRAPGTGWVFATMAYDGNAPGAAWYDRMVAVGSQWGNDPDLASGKLPPGTKPSESWINTDIKTPQHLGTQGRLNGPLDNAKSACMSCHSTAQMPMRSAQQPRSTATQAEFARWYRNLPGDTAFDNRSISTDYSLQTTQGLENFRLSKLLQ